MKFDEVVAKIPTITDLRRVASANVVDHNQLKDDQLRAALLKVRPQYLHEETVKKGVEDVLYRDSRESYRVLGHLLLVDVLLEQYGCSLSFAETEEAVLNVERKTLDRSNEVELVDMACGDKNSQRMRDVELYNFVLETAWEHRDQVSPDEANLLLNLRRRLKINERDHRTLEAKLGKFPQPGNELHTRSEIAQVRRHLQSRGLLFPVRQDDGTDFDVIPEELERILRSVLGPELRREAYRELLAYRPLRLKAHLTDVLSRAGVCYSKYDTVDTLVERVLDDVPPSRAIASSSPRFGLSSDELSAWCKELGLPQSGSMEERVGRIIEHFAQLRPRLEAEGDERELWYEFYEQLACRDREALRSQHIIDKDNEIESKFEHATRFLFQNRLNHNPLKQSGSNHPDGLLSLKSDYVMWDNKSKDAPGLLNLKECLPQFDGYMNQSDKRVPIFLVIAPGFTEDSEVEAIKYHAEHFDRNLVLITAGELKALADEWHSQQNKNREDPFPLGLLAASGRFDRKRLGKLF